MPRLVPVGALVALVTGVLLVASTILLRADGASVLFVVEDAGGGERRADALVIATWSRSCDELRLTSIPRDLALTSDSEVAAVLYETVGAHALARSMSEALDVDIGTVVAIDLEGAERITEAIGPVTIDLPAESLDRRTGFHAGPGPVELVGETAIEFLRSRTWEEHDGTDWQLVGTSDRARMGRAQTYVEQAIQRIGDSDLRVRARVAGAALGNASVALVDRLSLAAFLAKAGSADRVVHDMIPVVPERSLDERRSAFAPTQFDAAPRMVLDTAAGTPLGKCDGGSP